MQRHFLTCYRKYVFSSIRQATSIISDSHFQTLQLSAEQVSWNLELISHCSIFKSKNITEKYNFKQTTTTTTESFLRSLTHYMLAIKYVSKLWKLQNYSCFGGHKSLKFKCKNLSTQRNGKSILQSENSFFESLLSLLIRTIWIICEPLQCTL